jgi:hypothetical protein
VFLTNNIFQILKLSKNLAKISNLQKRHYLKKCIFEYFKFFYTLYKIESFKFKKNWEVLSTGFQNGGDFQNDGDF